MSFLFGYPKFKGFSNTGALLAGGKLYTYEPGTVTPKAAYQDSGNIAAHTNPIILDSNGEATIFLEGYYDIVLQNSAGVQQWTMNSVGRDAVETSLYGAQSILAAVSAGTPVSVAIAEQRLIGRITGGNIAALTAAQVYTLLGDKAVTEVDGHAGVNLTAAQCTNTIIYNTGQAAANVANVLPAAAAGYKFTAVVGTTQAENTWKFTAAAGNKIYLNGSAGTDGQSVIVTPAIGNYIRFFTFKTDNWDWIATTGHGTWTAGA